MTGFSAPPTGLSHANLHIVIHGFVLRKYTKPAHERNLQVFPILLQACFEHKITSLLTVTAPNTDGIINKLVTVFANAFTHKTNLLCPVPRPRQCSFQTYCTGTNSRPSIKLVPRHYQYSINLVP